MSTNPTEITRISTGRNISEHIQFKPGEAFKQNGADYKPFVFRPEQNELELPDDISDEDRVAYGETMRILRNAARKMSYLTQRLTDHTDGSVGAGVEFLVNNSQSLSPLFQHQIKGYLLSLLNFGGTLHDTKGCVLVPPCTREEFHTELMNIPAKIREGFDLDAWLDTIYDSTPRVTQGFYLFNTQEDFSLLEKSLPASYANNKKIVATLFDKAQTENLTESEWKEYEALSQQMMEMQSNFLSPILAKNDFAQGMSTRVHLTFGIDGELSLRSLHYLDVFSDELAAISDDLILAAQTLPESAQQTRRVLLAQAAWCKDSARDPNWGESCKEWVNAIDPGEFLDINVTAEEKVSHLGAKGDFHIAVSQHAPVPEALVSIFPVLAEQARAVNVETIFIRTLISGGQNEKNGVTAGEKLPDPEGRPLYKSMTMVNVAGGSMILAAADAFASATGIKIEDIGKYADAPLVGVNFHEFGHTKGAHVSELGVHSGSVEETNAQASAVYLTRMYAPDHAETVAVFEAAWMPVRRALQGVTEQHSRSDIALFQEYLNRGVVEVAERSDESGHYIRITDYDKLYEEAFKLALTMRLWEQGIPKSISDVALSNVKFDPNDYNQDKVVMDTIMASVKAEFDPDFLKAEAQRELDEYFSNSRLLEIADKMKPVLDSTPRTQGMSLFPSHPTICSMVGI